VKLIVCAIALVAGVLLWQHGKGGGDFVPLEPADPCVERPVGTIPAQLEPLAEQIVLTALDEAACKLGVTREELVLELGDPEQRRQIDPAVLKTGLEDAVDRLGNDLPKVSALLPEALDLANLPGLAQDAINAVPDSVIDSVLPTDELLQQAVDQLDVATVLGNLEDPSALEPALRDAILAGAKAEIIAKLPSPLRDLLG
jgi:hypothetical protein